MSSVTEIATEGRTIRMRLKGLDIENLRSIEQQTLQSCGEFNVLIGKNNSGKSNLLSAVSHFFSFLSGNSLATFELPLSNDVDYFARLTDRAIRLKGQLIVDKEEIDELFGNIGNEFPQVKHALPVVSAHDILNVDIEFRKEPTQIAYLRSIRHVDSNGFERSVLDVSIEAAMVLASRAEDLRTLSEDARIIRIFLRSLDEDDFTRLKQRRGIHPVFLREEPSSEQAQEVRKIIERSEDAFDASGLITALIEQLNARMAAIKSSALTSQIRAFAGDADIIPDYIVAILQKLSELRVLHLADRRQPIGAEEAGRLLQLKMSRGGGEVLKNIQTTVNALLGVEVDAFASDRPQRRMRATAARQRSQLPDAELDVGDFLVQANGSGVREALRLVLDLEFERPDLLLVEEPEIHLHPALEVAMMRYLKSVSSSTQVFLTTHSTNFLDTGDMRNIYMVQSAGSTKVRHLKIESAEAELPQELGIRLSSVFMYDRLVFVEGVSDELILRAFAEALGHNLSRANVGFVIMGGSRNFTHYATQATLSLLSKRQVEIFFVLDRDENSDGHVEELTNRLDGLAHLHVLRCREIENYLFDSSAIANLIEAKVRRSTGHTISVPPEEIRSALPEIADALRKFSVAKRVAASICGVHRVSRDRILELSSEGDLTEGASVAISELMADVEEVRGELGSVIERTEHEISEVWEAEKLVLAPGHEVLDGVFKKYGLRFNKDRDSGDLAAVLSKPQISAEIRDLLGKICGSPPG